LVDYTPSYDAFKDAKDYILEEDEQDDSLLEEENCAWTRGKPRLPKSTQSHRSSARNFVRSPQQAEMIDMEDRAWAMPGKTSRRTGLPSFAASVRRAKVPNPSGIQPELLDPEDRAWM